LNIQDEDKDQNIKKNKDSKKSAKEHPFSVEEFNDFKKQIGGNKLEKIVKKVDAHVSKKSTKSSPTNNYSKPNSKISKKGSTTERIKRAKPDRNESSKREKFSVKSSNKSNSRKEYSKSKTFISTPEENDIESIKNSILRIKKKAFDKEDTPKRKSGKRSPKFTDPTAQAFVSVSSINLGNVKGKKLDDGTNNDRSHLAGNIPDSSVHQNDHSGSISESEVFNLANKEPESHHPSGFKDNTSSSMRRTYTLGVGLSGLVTDLVDETSDHGEKTKPVSKVKPSKLLKYSGDIKSTSKAYNQKAELIKIPSNTEKKGRTVRFKEDSDHQRQKSGYDFYSMNCI
jgi:hypothetical protein